MTFTLKGLRRAKKPDKYIIDAVSAIDGAGEIELSMLEASTEAKIIVYGADGVANDVAVSGDVTITAAGAVAIGNQKVVNAMVADNAIGNDEMADNAVGQAEMRDDAVGAAELKVVERNITIAGGAASGTVTNAADANGVILGVIPYAACESAIKDVTFTTATGEIAVELLSAQTGGVNATVTAIVLQV